MIEGLAAIGLAGNIVQFISFSFALVSKSTEIRQSASGLSNEIVDFNIISEDIRTFSRGLLSNAASSKRLSDIAKHCDTVAEELLEAISQLRDKQQVSGSGKGPTRWQSFRKALKCVWEKGHIDELKARLELLRDQVTMHLVSDTRLVEPILWEFLLSLIVPRVITKFNCWTYWKIGKSRTCRQAIRSQHKSKP
jgi:hypothetical protein